MPALDSAREQFAALDVQVLDISVDSIYSHKAWQKFEIGEMHIPMCSDFYPHGQVTEAYGIMRQGPPLSGISERAVFIVDKRGKIAFAKMYPLDQVPKIDELLEAVRRIEKS